MVRCLVGEADDVKYLLLTLHWNGLPRDSCRAVVELASSDETPWDIRTIIIVVAKCLIRVDIRRLTSNRGIPVT